MRRHAAKTRAPRVCVFAGPSLAGHAHPPGIDVLPPATRGALIDAVGAGYTRLGFIDGAVDATTQVPLREIREVLALPEVCMFGAASMGAIRAVQLADCGMQGLGRVYRLFRRGILTNSDEVFVLHAPEPLRYRALTLPLVNIRYTLRAMRRQGHLSCGDARAIAEYMREVPWFDRDKRSVSAAVFTVCGSTRCGSIRQAFDASYRDVKREDAMFVLAMLFDSFVHRARSASIARLGIR